MRRLDPTLHGESLEIGRIESDELADLVEWDTTFVDESSHEPDRYAEACGRLLDVDERRARGRCEDLPSGHELYSGFG